MGVSGSEGGRRTAGTRGRVAIVAGAVSAICAVTLAATTFLDAEVPGGSGAVFTVMMLAALTAVVAGIPGLRRPGQRPLAVAGIALSVPALAVLALAVLFVILAFTGVIEIH